MQNVTENNDKVARAAVQSGVAMFDRSQWGCIRVSDRDRIRFLHNQSTNDFERLQPGQGCDTVFVTSTGRTIDLVTAYVTEDAVLLLVSPNRCAHLMQWMDRFIFFADRVVLKDLTDDTAIFTVLGEKSDALIEHLGAGAIVGQPDATHQVFQLGDLEVRVAVGSGLVTRGYTLITAMTDAPKLLQLLTTAGAVSMSSALWEQLRIEQGRPMPDHELTEDFNPLEAGLWHTISLSKGCYIGQETIARLHTYRGVKQQLWGVRLSNVAEPGSGVMVGDEKIGTLTSCTTIEQGVFGLAYIRTKAVAAGLQVHVGTSQGELVAVPFVQHEYP